MRRGAKIALGLLVALVVLLAVNTFIVGGETKEAETTIDGGEILNLPGGDVQVLDEGDPRGTPVVLLHCYSCSLHWWDELAPILAEDHRVIRIDLLGHGGSQKPSSGYEIEEQAALVAAAMDELEVQGAVVVGHSMGFSVATALADRASQLADRLVNIGEGPNNDLCELPFIARLSYVPVIGEAVRRISPSFAIRDGYSDAFAPGFDLADGFPNEDQVVDDYKAMTFTSFKDAHDANHDYIDEIPLNERLQNIPVPLLSIFGSEDQICEPDESQEAYRAVPGARVTTMDNAGHSPNVERPQDTAEIIERFAADAGDANIPPPPRNVGQGRGERGGDGGGRGSGGGGSGGGG